MNLPQIDHPIDGATINYTLRTFYTTLVNKKSIVSESFTSGILIKAIELLKVSWLYEMQLSNKIWGHSEYSADLFFELKLVSPFNSVESWLV